MEEEKTYEIYTDASFDDETKIGTYAIVVIQGNNIVKVISKKCRIKFVKNYHEKNMDLNYDGFQENPIKLHTIMHMQHYKKLKIVILKMIILKIKFY